ncbi:MAG: hypothetical protein ACO25K_05700 [Candidatus Fonsibacter ubiquis]
MNDEIIALTEGPSRGFLSNYVTILNAIKWLINDGYDGNNIFISPSMFSLYGNPINWFSDTKVLEPKGSKILPSTIYCDNMDPWPTKDQVELKKFSKYIPYNSRINLYLDNNLKNTTKSLGIHFRGTDHSMHVDRIPIEKYIEESVKEFQSNKYESIFIATDEENIIEMFENVFMGIQIIHNNTIKSKDKITPLHKSYGARTPKELIDLGDQVLLDSHSISNCKKVICKTSNIINYARILNPELDVLYIDKNQSFRG